MNQSVFLSKFYQLFGPGGPEKGGGMIRKALMVALCGLMFVFLAAPIPATLPSVSGTVASDYVDQSSIRKVVYKILMPDGTYQDVYSKDEEIQEKLDRAASGQRNHQADGEIYGVGSEY